MSKLGLSGIEDLDATPSAIETPAESAAAVNAEKIVPAIFIVWFLVIAFCIESMHAYKGEQGFESTFNIDSIQNLENQMLNPALQAANLIERIGRLARTEEQIGDLYPAQWAVLRYLSRANRFSRTPMAMTKYLSTTRGTMSQTIIALEKKSYVERRPSATDKRSVNVKLTKLGRVKLDSDPLLKLAADMDNALGKQTTHLSELLESLLREVVRGNEGQMFGQCKTCRHFVEGNGSDEIITHQCGLLDVTLSQKDSHHICVEHEC